MIKYLSTLQTNIISIQDINLTSLVKRIVEEDDEQQIEKLSVFKKVDDINSLTNDNLKYHMCSMLVCIEIARSSKMVDMKNPSNNIIKIYGLIYKLFDDDHVYIEPIVADDIKSAGDIFNKRIELINNIDKESISIYSIGKVSKNHKLDENIRYKISILEQGMSGLLIKKEFDSFKEFNRKIYTCDLEEEPIDGQ